MTPENGFREPDYSSWVIPPTQPKPPPKRWCPTHRRWEANPKGRLLCDPAWEELYEMERKIDAEMMSSNTALIQLSKNIGDLVEEMRLDDMVAEPPTKPQQPPPPPQPAPRRPQAFNGKGGVQLP